MNPSLLHRRALERRQKERVAEKKEKLQINTIPVDEFLQQESLEFNIANILRNGALHLILIRRNLNPRPTIYQIRKAINENYYMFFEPERNVFYLRDAFLKPNFEKPEIKPREKLDRNIPSLKDIIKTVINRCGIKEACTSKIYNILLSAGCRISYSAVRRALQDVSYFKRTGFSYAIARADSERVPPASSRSQRAV
jgi:hypothetical protein